jgi:hypothetical protein
MDRHPRCHRQEPRERFVSYLAGGTIECQQLDGGGVPTAPLTGLFDSTI